ELREARSELALVARRTTLDAVSAAIAHEIKQPLAAVVAHANAGLRWLGRTPPDLDEVRDTLTNIAADGHRASDVIQSVRAMFSRSDHGGTLLDANDLVRETIAIAHGELESQAIRVELELAAQRLPVHAHPRHL